MRYLFSPESLKELRVFLRRKVLFAFDFDGTLARIVPAPQAAGMEARTEGLLKRLASQSEVAVISGRGLKDLKGRMGFELEFVVGNHGAEGIPGGQKMLKKAAQSSRRWVGQIECEMNPQLKSRELSLSGDTKFWKKIELEDKKYTVTLHYRNFRRRALARDRLLGFVRDLKPMPRIVLGKSVINLIPEGLPHKGDSLIGLLKRSGLKAGFYIGDDDTDEDVFGLTGAPIFTVRVGRRANSAAMFYLKRQSEMNRLLEFLLEHGTSDTI